MQARRSGVEFVLIVLGIFHFHAVFVFWVAVRRSLPRPRAILLLATGSFLGKSSGVFGPKLGSVGKVASARIACRWLHGSGRSFLLVPFRNLSRGASALR